MALIGLEGTGDKVFDTPIYFWDVESAIRIMHAFGAATHAGDFGAITVWEDVEYNIHVEFSRYFRAVSKVKYSAIDDVRVWLEKWIPAVNDAEALEKLIEEQESEG